MSLKRAAPSYTVMPILPYPFGRVILNKSIITPSEDVILETHILCVVDMHVLAVSLFLYFARPALDVATISASMVLCLLAGLGADSSFAGTDDYCRP